MAAAFRVIIRRRDGKTEKRAFATLAEAVDDAGDRAALRGDGDRASAAGRARAGARVRAGRAGRGARRAARAGRRAGRGRRPRRRHDGGVHGPRAAPAVEPRDREDAWAALRREAAGSARASVEAMATISAAGIRHVQDRRRPRGDAPGLRRDAHHRRRRLGPPADRRRGGRGARRLPELGVDFIDTADSYGPDVLRGAHRRGAGALRRRHVATKGGFTRHGPERAGSRSGGREYLRQCALMSLRRLRRRARSTCGSCTASTRGTARRAVRRAEGLQDEGNVRHLGLSRGLRRGDQGRPGGLRGRDRAEPLQPDQPRSPRTCSTYCEEQGIGFIPWFPLAAGELAEPGGAVDAIAAAPTTRRRARSRWRGCWRKSPVMLPIPGTGSVEHLEENVAAADLRLSDEELATLDAASAARASLEAPVGAQGGERLERHHPAPLEGDGGVPGGQVKSQPPSSLLGARELVELRVDQRVAGRGARPAWSGRGATSSARERSPSTPASTLQDPVVGHALARAPSSSASARARSGTASRKCTA